MLGEYQPALESVQRAIAIDAEFSLSYLSLALIRAETGRDRDAREAVDSLLAIDPKFSRRAYCTGLPFRDPQLEARRESALLGAGLPE